MKYFGDNSLAKLIALIKDTLSTHADDTSIHVTVAEKKLWGESATTEDINGKILSHNYDTSSHPDIREALSKAGKPFIIEGTLADAIDDNSYMITGVSKSRAETKAAVQAGELVMFRLTNIDLPLTQFSFDDGMDAYNFSAVVAGLSSVALYYDGTQSQAVLMTTDIPPLSNNTPSAPGTASAGTSSYAARADHVHPSELPKATLVTLSSASWDASAKTQTVDVAGIDADESKQVIYVTPYSADTQAYKDAGIQMSAQAAGKATFICESVPTSAVKVWVVVEDVYDVSPVKHSLKFSSPSAFSISVGTPGWDGTMKYSTDGTVWKTWTGTEISGALTDDKYVLYVQGVNNTKIAGNTSKAWVLTGGNITCDGNIETLLDYAAVAAGYHPQMADQCYSYMFYNCTSLTSAPALPATTLASHCYESMFRGCTSLTTAPALPATTLADSCYQEMFSSCVNLTAAPALPATTLAHYCYGDMFRDCISLTTAPALPATTLADECYIRMFRNCTGLTTPPALPATTLAAGCYGGVFYGCTGLTTAPALPATTLTDTCYANMFYGCTKLKLSATQTGSYTKAYRIPTSGTGVVATDALTNMFDTTGGTFAGTPEINTTYYLDASNTII